MYSRFVQDHLRGDLSAEFQRFEAWLETHNSLTPFRSEWSIYEEDYAVAGQIDSLWFDTAADNTIVMADWKRTRKVLSPDVEVQRRQVFNECKGLATYPFSATPGPCAHLYDCPYNHYLAQQNLYAYFLENKYDIRVAILLLVQCHPDYDVSGANFNDIKLSYEPEFALKLLKAYHEGWNGQIII